MFLKNFLSKISRNQIRNVSRFSKFRIALVQSKVVKDRDKNLDHVNMLIERATDDRAELVCLPECFNCPYGIKFFQTYAESIPDGPTSQMLSKAARENDIYLIGGTYPEIDCGKIYNTCTAWSPEGEMIAKYRKIHLFDIDVPGITFKESEILCAGNEFVTFDMCGITIGLAICYDLRFEELARVYREKGCKMIFYPGAFTMKTGPEHWELLQRSRAVDNQVFVCSVSPARGDKGYIAWGHSQITNPWGHVIAQASHGEEILYCDIDMRQCDTVREQIPIYTQKRNDIYDTIIKKKFSC